MGCEKSAKEMETTGRWKGENGTKKKLVKRFTLKAQGKKVIQDRGYPVKVQGRPNMS